MGALVKLSQLARYISQLALYNRLVGPVVLGLYRSSSWTSLSSLGRIRIFQSSYLFFVLVPIIARLLYKLPEDVEIRSLGAVFRISLALPFSWTMFYFSSVFFVIATSLYYVFCPQIIKDFRSFRAFQEEGRSQEAIKRLLLDSLFIVWSPTPAWVITRYNEFVEQYCSGSPYEGPITTKTTDLIGYLNDHLRSIKLKEDAIADAFWHIRHLPDRTRAMAREGCLFAYLFGFALLLFVVAQNFMYVWRLAFR